MPDRVLVLGNDSRSFLAVIRSLGRQGLEVHAAHASPAEPALASRYVARVHPLPDHDLDPDGWLAALRQVLSCIRFALVVPCNDQSILPLQANRAELATLAPLYLLPAATQDLVNNKQRTTALARQLGIPVPREITPAQAGDVRGAVLTLGLPLVVKPVTSFRLHALRQKQLVRRVHSEAELERLLRALADVEVILQEDVPGTGVGVEALAYEGDILYAFQHERVHEPPGGGGSSYRCSVPLDGELLQASQRLLRALRYTGVAMVEFRQDRRRGAWVLLEINGRFWGSLPLAVAAGADFPFYLYEMLVRGRREFPPGYRIGIYARNLTGDAAFLWQQLRSGQLHRRLPGLLLEMRHLLLGRERLDTLTLDDPAPALAELRSLERQAATALASRLSWSAYQLPWLRTYQRRRMRAHLGSARRILFVCKGNIYRSPFAAAWARQRWPDRSIQSAGYQAEPGRPSPRAAVEAAARQGVDLRSHRARLLEGAMLTWAEAILTFDREGWRLLWSCHPQVRPRLHLLAEVPDPDGGTVEECAASYSLIQSAVDALLSAPAPPAGRCSSAPAPHLRGAAEIGPFPGAGWPSADPS
ncbi:MAG: ATP-grasp domain-containing protein [Myxococcota bacterium]|nr:ATP-grasp domain-containing protein [Myxococcota bacterium]